MAFRPKVPVKPGWHLVTAGTSAEQGHLSFWLWPSSVNEAQLTFLDFSPFFSCLWDPMAYRLLKDQDWVQPVELGNGSALTWCLLSLVQPLGW